MCIPVHSLVRGAHLLGRGGPPAGLPCGSQVPTYSSMGIRPLFARGGTCITMCRPAVRVQGHAGGGVCRARLQSGSISVGGGGRGSKTSAPLFPGPQGEPAHGLHPRFVVAEIWADWVQGGGGYVPRSTTGLSNCGDPMFPRSCPLNQNLAHVRRSGGGGKKTRAPATGQL